MAKRERVLPARRREQIGEEDDSMLIRSAEALGRVIGSLQRELDRAARRLYTEAPSWEVVGRKDSSRKKTSKKTAARKTAKKR